METIVIDLVSLVPQLALAGLVVWVVLKRDESWQRCFRESTAEYKQLIERLEKVIIANTEIMALVANLTQFRQELTKELIAQVREVVEHTK